MAAAPMAAPTTNWRVRVVSMMWLTARLPASAG